MTALRDLLLPVLQDADRPIVISRHASPRLVATIAPLAPATVPVVRGRALWSLQRSGTAVAEWPTWLGALESEPHLPAVAVVPEGTRPPWSVAALFEAGTESARWRPVDWSPGAGNRHNYDERTRQMVGLAAALVQLKRVHLAWPVASPVAVLLLPISPARLLDEAAPPPGLIAAPVPGLAELPGGLRCELTSSVDEQALRFWVEAVAACLAGTGVGK